MTQSEISERLGLTRLKRFSSAEERASVRYYRVQINPASKGVLSMKMPAQTSLRIAEYPRAAGSITRMPILVCARNRRRLYADGHRGPQSIAGCRLAKPR